MNFKAFDVDGKMMRTSHLALAVALAACAALFPAGASADSILPVRPAAARGPANGLVELDTTGSGAVDYRVYYDGRGNVAREEIASRHDGRMDTFYYYKDGVLQRVEIDSRGTGRVDLWVYLLDGTYIQRWERDTTGSGKPDVVRVFGQN